MEFKLAENQKLSRFPPKRGQVLKGIFRHVFGSAGGIKSRKNGLGGQDHGLSSSSSTPAEIPNGYSSDAASES